MDNFFDALFDKYVVFFIFFVIGSIEIIIFYFIKRSRKKKMRTWYETEATVIDVIAGKGRKGGTIYYPVFRYKTHLSEVIERRSLLGSNPNYYTHGTEVTIYYNPDKPTSYIVKDDKRLRLAFMILTIVFGIFFLVGAAGILWLASVHGLI